MLTGIFLCMAAEVVDGDTLRCANIEDANGRVRLARIDTPERGRPGFDEASRALEAMIAGRTVRCQHVDASPFEEGFQDRDRYGRIVARCFVDGVDLGEKQVRSGMATRWP